MMGLAVIFTVLAIAIIAFVALFWTKKEDMLNELGKTWNDADWKKEAEIVEEEFECCGFDEERFPKEGDDDWPYDHKCMEEKYNDERCYSTLEDFLTKNANIAGAVLLVTVIGLVLGVIIALCNACKDGVENEKEQVW